jgi:hypothetical protein
MRKLMMVVVPLGLMMAACGPGGDDAANDRETPAMSAGDTTGTAADSLMGDTSMARDTAR